MNQPPVRRFEPEAFFASRDPSDAARDQTCASNPGPVRVHKRRSLALSSLGEIVLDSIAIAVDDRRAPRRARVPGAPANPTRLEHAEFLVRAGGLCIPTDGVLRIEEHSGAYYVVGHTSWEACWSRAHADVRLATRIAEIDPHHLADEAIALGDADAEAELCWDLP